MHGLLLAVLFLQSEQGLRSMRLLQIRVRTDQDAECLMRELAVFGPKRRRLAISIGLEEREETVLLACLSALETCLLANEIPSVRVELDGKPYLLEPATTD
jgi:hypothetical protein